MTFGRDAETKDHHNLRRAAVVAAGAGGVAAAGAMSYRAWRKHRNDILNAQVLDKTVTFERNIAILQDERLRPAVRDLMARLAVNIYLATLNPELGIITREELMQQLHTKQAITQKALSNLNDYDLIARMSHPTSPKRQGYFATPVLHWAIENGASEPLAQAMYELNDPDTNGN